MVIRPEQIEALTGAMTAVFVLQCVAHLHVDFPHEIARRQMNSEALESMVEGAISKAHGYGIRDGSDLELYIDCAFLFGSDFDRSCVWASEILNRTELSAEDKMIEINDYLIFGRSEPL